MQNFNNHEKGNKLELWQRELWQRQQSVISQLDLDPLALQTLQADPIAYSHFLLDQMQKNKEERKLSNHKKWMIFWAHTVSIIPAIIGLFYGYNGLLFSIIYMLGVIYLELVRSYIITRESIATIDFSIEAKIKAIITKLGISDSEVKIEIDKMLSASTPMAQAEMKRILSQQK